MAPSPPAGPRSRARTPALFALLLCAGCGHTEPFTSPPYGTDAPFDPAPPQRLTYNALADRWAEWLADGSGLLYSAQQESRQDRDVCLALLPPTGGHQQELWCDVPRGAGATDAIESAAASVEGRLGFLTATGTRGAANPERQWLAVASSLDPFSARMVQSFPTVPEGGALQSTAAYVRWLDPSRLVYVGQVFSIRRPCTQCPLDTVRVGREVTIVEVDRAGTAPTALPTGRTTGLAVMPGGEAVAYTLEGRSQVFRFNLATGQSDVLHDFGPAGIARDVHLAAGRLAAIVGGRVALAPDPEFGQVQWDSGGRIHLVDLASGDGTVLDGGALRLYRRPVLSPGGDRLVAEGYPLIVVGPDTTVARSGDLYLFGAP